MDEETLKEYWNIYTECWKLFKRNCNPVDTVDFWENLVKECHELRKRFPSEFARHQIVLTYTEIERLQREKLEKELALAKTKG